jgi:hypothetical protein
VLGVGSDKLGDLARVGPGDHEVPGLTRRPARAVSKTGAMQNLHGKKTARSTVRQPNQIAVAVNPSQV